MEGLQMQTVEEASRGAVGDAVARGWLRSVAPMLGIVASWLILRPYLGVVHDALLYFHFAAFGDEDPAFGRLDVVVANDQQMGRSVFVPIIRPLVRAFGVGATALVTTIVGLSAWIGALIGLARVLVGRHWWILTIAFPAFGAYWGPLFLLAEPFSTPRVFAEAAVLGAIALALTDRTWYGLVLVAFGVVLHPIIGLSGLAVVLVIAVWNRPRWIGGLALATLVGIGIAAWDPLNFAGTRVFTSPWLEIIADQASLVLPGEWSAVAWVNTFFGFSLVLSLYLCARTDRIRKLSMSTLIVSAAGLAVSVAFSWLVLQPFITQLQPWRVLWILHVAAIVAVIVLSLDAWGDRRPEVVLRALAAWMLALTAGTRALPEVNLLIGVACLPLLLPAATSFQWRLAEPRIVRLMAWAVGIMAGLQLMGGLIAITGSGVAAAPVLGIASRLPATTLLVAVIAIASVAGLMRRGPFRPLASVVLAGLLVFGAVTWDHRTDWQRYTESLEEAIVSLPEDALVLTEYNGFAAASLTRRPTYYSGYAGAGVVFSESLALTYDHHARVARSLGVPYAWEYRYGTIPDEAIAPPAAAAIGHACDDPLGPTHLLLRRMASGLPGSIWVSPVEIDDTPDDSASDVYLDEAFVLYTCDDIAG